MANYDLDYEGSVVQNILDTGKELEDNGYIFMGTATPSTIPGTPTERVAYIGGPGTYNNFGTTVVVPSGGIGVFKYNGSAWANTVINASGDGYVYQGIATTTTNPGTPTGKVMYIAIAAGAYTNFGGQVLTSGINILKYDGSGWSQEQVLAIDAVPTAGSTNMVESGGVFFNEGMSYYQNAEIIPAANYPNIDYYFSSVLAGARGARICVKWKQESGELANRTVSVYLMNVNSVVADLGTVNNGKAETFDISSYSVDTYNKIRLLWSGGSSTQSNSVEVSIASNIEGEILKTNTRIDNFADAIFPTINVANSVLQVKDYNNLELGAANYPQVNFVTNREGLNGKQIEFVWNQATGDLVDKAGTLCLMNGSSWVADLGNIRTGVPLYADLSKYAGYNTLRLYFVSPTSVSNFINVEIKVGIIPKIEGRQYKQKKIAVFGDSISTYENWCIGNNSWYGPEGEASAGGLNNVSSVKQTYWWKLSEALKAAITINDSWSGSCVSYSGWGFNTNKEHSFVDRIQNGLFGKSRLLNGQSVAPDIIILNGGTNDSRPEVPYVGDYKYADWVEADFAYFRPAYAYVIDQLKYWNPNALIICIGITELEKESILDSIETIAAHYELPYLEVTLGSGGQGNGHPSQTGHNKIFEKIYDYIMKNY